MKRLKNIIMILVLIITVLIPVNSLAANYKHGLSNGNGEVEIHNGEVWISSFKANNFGTTSGRNITYKIEKCRDSQNNIRIRFKDNSSDNDYNGRPRLQITQGCLCLEHGSGVTITNSSHKYAKRRVYIEGKHGWYQTASTEVYDSIKDKQNEPNSKVVDRGNHESFAKVAYLMAYADKDTILGASGSGYSAEDGGWRHKSGVQGALWHFSRTFMSNINFAHQGTDYTNVWQEYTSTKRSEANDYADKVSNYSEPKVNSNGQEKNWKKVGSRYVVGPFNFSFTSGDDVDVDVIVYDDSNNVFSDAFVCKGTGESKTAKNGVNFYISVPTSFTGGKVKVRTTRKIYVFDGYIYAEELSDGQNQLFGTSKEKTLKDSVTSEKFDRPSLKLLKKDNETGETLAGFKFKIEGQNEGKTYTVTTNSNGEATIDPIEPDTYKITEISVGNNSDYDVSYFKPVTVTVRKP